MMREINLKGMLIYIKKKKKNLNFYNFFNMCNIQNITTNTNQQNNIQSKRWRNFCSVNWDLTLMGKEEGTGKVE